MTLAYVVRLKVNGRKISGADGDRPDLVPIRAWRRIMKHGMMTMGRHWHEKFLPLHFGPKAARRYKGAYQPRTTEHVLRKRGISKSDINSRMAGAPSERGARRRFRERVKNQLVSEAGGRDYLRFRGTLQQLSKNATFRAFQTRVNVEIPAPAYVKSKRYPNSPDMMHELSAVLPSEVQELERVAQDTIDQSLQQFAATRQLPQIAA